jgi:hypothetical protein
VHYAGDLVALADRPQRVQVGDVGLLRGDGQVREMRGTWPLRRCITTLGSPRPCSARTVWEPMNPDPEKASVTQAA